MGLGSGIPDPGVKKAPDPGSATLARAGFRIRIHLIRIRIQHFRLTTDPDPDPIRIQGFHDQKLEKIYS